MCTSNDDDDDDDDVHSADGVTERDMEIFPRAALLLNQRHHDLPIYIHKLL